MQVTLEQARDIVDGHDGNQGIDVASLSEIVSSYTTSYKLYYITLSESDKAYVLLVSPPPSLSPIPLPALAVLLHQILDNTAVPVPRPIAHDTSGKWPFGWLLLRPPGPPHRGPLPTLASMRPHLTPTQLARIELRLGTHLRALHGLTRDWFGAPGDEAPPTPSLETMFASQTGEEAAYGGDMIPYSWQDTFMLQLEDLLDQACAKVDVQALRRSLFRAIGSFLFDDVEMPRFVWVTGNDEDVVVSQGDVAYLLPTFGHVLWGDPMMETWFMPPGPSRAISQGYFDGEEDGTLIVFPRHKTKRTWYTVYLALLILAEGGERTQWAKDMLAQCIAFLEDAPCY